MATSAAAEAQALFEKRYANEKFVDVLPAGSEPETRSVRGSNRCQIAGHQVDGRRALVLSVIDNLVKGAAGQAIQGANVRFDLPEGMGLEQPAAWP